MVFKTANEFYSKLQKYGFINQEDEDEIDPVITWVDIDDLITCGVPIDPFDGSEMILYAMVEPGEEV